jgi:putative endonuclease
MCLRYAKLMNTIGTLGEDIACKIYLKRGFVILVNNFYNQRGKRVGEIDFIVRKDNDIHFVEVKTRSSNRFGDIAESLTAHKLRRIKKALDYFLLQNPQYQGLNSHFDFVAIELNRFDKRVQRIRIYSDVIVDSY